jgi:hypothetical protein
MNPLISNFEKHRFLIVIVTAKKITAENLRQEICRYIFAIIYGKVVVIFGRIFL